MLSYNGRKMLKRFYFSFTVKVEIHFRVTGRGRVGADGLAFWYTENKGIEGPVSKM